ncbi:MAG TPA: hypothetical protein DD827_08690 [Gammaproteobacteria bacterium]|jgi:hypothetical protein|nr:hypothetical protein [Gammaproteobacteria bacterium]
MGLASLVFSTIILGVVIFTVAVLIQLRRKYMFTWLSAWIRGDWREQSSKPIHVIFCFADHFEPQWRKPERSVEDARVDRWAKDYPTLARKHLDSDGRHPVHTFFYPEEEYREEHLDKLQGICEQGLGEIEIHLHHDHDTSAGFMHKLKSFVDILHNKHDALPLCPQTQRPLFAFIHGNFALDNAHEDGSFCGVNDELIILNQAGCYADFTLPSAPCSTQTKKINSIYYAKDNPTAPKSHDDGQDVRVGGKPWGDLMIIQGPLALNWKQRKWGVLPKIESCDIRKIYPPTRDRVDLWVDTGVHVQGKPDWVFVKVHTHGAQDDDMDTLLGNPMDEMFNYLETKYNDGENYNLHYVSSREMYNMTKAAEAGEQGLPGDYRDYILPPPTNLKLD